MYSLQVPTGLADGLRLKELTFHQQVIRPKCIHRVPRSRLRQNSAKLADGVKYLHRRETQSQKGVKILRMSADREGRRISADLT